MESPKKIDSSNFQLTEQHVLNCQLPIWYSQFKHVTFPTEFLALPKEFVDYLEEDGFFVSESLFPKRPDENDRFDCGEPLWSDEEGEGESKVKEFPELENEIEKLISKLGGYVFPKLNWSSPKDATMFNSSSSSLRCSSSKDIILMLKSSDLISHDLKKVFSFCPDKKLNRPDPVFLVLRKWFSLQESHEFRCFVKNDLLIGISQRNISNYFEVLNNEESKLKKLILNFFKSTLELKFPDKNFIFDVYVSKNGKVYLLDINPWAEFTDPALFDWEELLAWALPPSSSLPSPSSSSSLLDFSSSSLLHSSSLLDSSSIPSSSVPLVSLDSSSPSSLHSSSLLDSSSLNSSSVPSVALNSSPSAPSSSFPSSSSSSSPFSSPLLSPSASSSRVVQFNPDEDCEIRIISSPGGIRPSIALASRVPFDFINWSNDPSNNSSMSDLIDQLKAIQKGQAEN